MANENGLRGAIAAAALAIGATSGVLLTPSENAKDAAPAPVASQSVVDVAAEICKRGVELSGLSDEAKASVLAQCDHPTQSTIAAVERESALVAAAGSSAPQVAAELADSLARKAAIKARRRFESDNPKGEVHP
jgi:hypothetical protein